MKKSHIFFLFVLIALLCFSTYVDAASRIVNFALIDEQRTRQLHRTHLFRTFSWYILRRANSVSFRVVLDSQLSDGQTMSLQVAPFSILDGSTIRINHLGGGNYDLTAMIPADAPVGVFSMGIRLSNSNQVRQLPKQIVVLFNAWSPEDVSYFPRPAELAEYIDNEHGITYRGTSWQVQDVRWFFGQFSQECLTVVLYGLNKLTEAQRRDPAHVTRFLTKFSSFQEGMFDGVMEGKWEGGFGGGTNPSSWQSSDQVFRTYIAQGFRPVRYAQCWVFAAVYMSMTRALGLATAQVSVMDSCHEYAAEKPGIYMQRIGRYFERNQRYMIAESGKIWNYHSFNVVYFQNVHAPHPYNLPDWQVLDATPQEPSEGSFQLGPAPLRAVRDFRKINWDTSFVISEVSARYHNFLAVCQWHFGGGKTLPPGCRVVQDLGSDPHVPSGTYIVAKSAHGFIQQPWTHMFHTRARSPAEDPSVMNRFRAVRAFDTLANEPSTVGTLSHSIVSASFDQYANMEAESIANEEHPLPPGNGLENLDPSQVDTEMIKRGYTDPTADVALYNYPDTGVALSVIIPTVKLGQPLEIFLNFACEMNTMGYNDDMMSSTDKTTRVITLQVNGDEIVHDDTGSPFDDDDDEDDMFPLLDTNEETTEEFEALAARFGEMTPALRPRRISKGKSKKINTADGHMDSIAQDRPGAGASSTLMSSARGQHCPSEAKVSFRLQLSFTDYTSALVSEITDVSGEIVLHQDNGFFESYHIVVNDYIGKAVERSLSTDQPIPQYIKAIVMASDHSTDPTHDIVMVAQRNAMVTLPKLSLLTDSTRLIIPRQGTGLVISGTDNSRSRPQTGGIVTAAEATLIKKPVAVSVMFTNQLPFEMTNVTLTIIADNLGFEQQILTLNTLQPGEVLHYIHDFDAATSIDGLHYYKAVLESKQLEPVVGELHFHVNCPDKD